MERSASGRAAAGMDAAPRRRTRRVSMAFPFQDDIRSALCGALAVMTKPTFPRCSRTDVKISAFPLPWKPDARRAMDAWCAPTAGVPSLPATHQKRDTKKGPRRQEAGMATPLPNSAHGDQLISAKARGTAPRAGGFLAFHI